MVDAQPPSLQGIQTNILPTGIKYPFWLSAHDNDGLRRRAQALRSYLGRQPGRQSLDNLSYNVCPARITALSIPVCC